MYNAIWYGILLILYSLGPGTSPESGSVDVYINSSLGMTLQIRGDYRSGTLYSAGEIAGEYDSTPRYRQAYMVFSRMDELMSSDTQVADTASSSAAMSDATDSSMATPGSDMQTASTDSSAGSAEPQFAGGYRRPFAIDLTPVLAGRRTLAAGDSVELPPSGYADVFQPGDAGGSPASGNSNGGAMTAGTADGSGSAVDGVSSGGNWTLRRTRGQIIASNEGMGIIVIYNF